MSGASGFDGVIGGSARAGLSVFRGRLIATVRSSASVGSSTVEDTGLLGGFLSEEYYDLGVLVGLTPQGSGDVRFITGAGLAMVWGQRAVGREQRPCDGFCGTEYEDVGPTVGAVLEAGAYGRIWRGIGYSIIAHANVNGEQSFAGVTLGLAVGTLP